MKTVRPLHAASNLLRSSRTPPPLCRAAPRDRSRRSFVSNPFNTTTQPQTLIASRTLQYPARAIYSIIADINSYSTFLPYCQHSLVTKYSSPAAADGKRYPEEAKLVIGFNDSVSEEFTSRVTCLPHTIVEAVSGNTASTIADSDVPHHSPRREVAAAEDHHEDPTRQTSALSHLLTRWTLRPFPYKPPPLSATQPGTTHRNHEETSDVPGQEKTEVTLAVEFRFANPVYAALSAAAAPAVAEKMIEAFETRVRSVMEGPGWVNEKGR